MDGRLRSLADSIRERGILEPLLVRELSGVPAGGRRFELLAGFRRYTAARLLNLPRVPVRVIASSDAEARATNLAENLAREELPELDALRAVVQLSET